MRGDFKQKASGAECEWNERQINKWAASVANGDRTPSRPVIAFIRLIGFNGIEHGVIPVYYKCEIIRDNKELYCV